MDIRVEQGSLLEGRGVVIIPSDSHVYTLEDLKTKAVADSILAEIRKSNVAPLDEAHGKLEAVR